MKKNIGISDRLMRFVMVDLLLGAPLYGMEMPAIFANITFVCCMVLILTILTGYSPVYHLLGFSTKDIKTVES